MGPLLWLRWHLTQGTSKQCLRVLTHQHLYCRYFHAVLVRNTGRRVPNTAPDSLPPRNTVTDTATTASPSAAAAPQPMGKGRSAGAHSRLNGATSSAGVRATADGSGAERGPERERGPPERQRGALDKLAKGEGGASEGATPLPAQRIGTRSMRERSDDMLSRGSSVHPAHARTTGEGGLLRENDSLQNLHHSTHGARSAASQAVNTASTIDSMLVGAQARDAVPQKEAEEPAATGEEDMAHAQAIANLGHPGEGARRYEGVRVFDINTDGPPRGIPEDWEDGLLEGRRRPDKAVAAAASASASGAAAGSAGAASAAPAHARNGVAEHQREHAGHAHLAAAAGGAGEGAKDGVASARLQAAQHAAEQSVEQAKKRAARAKMVRALAHRKAKPQQSD
jgi:hypothetical protein